MGKISKLTIPDSDMNFSVFIPTYNRDEALRATLQSVFDHWNPQNLYEIIISDNNDKMSLTTEIVESFESSVIRHSKNKENIGIDRNMLRYLDLCKTKYCWLLGDDDFLNSSSYTLIAPYLSYDFDFLIMLNGSQKTSFGTGIHKLENKEDIGVFFSNFWDKLPFGNLIVNVEVAKSVEQTKSKYIGSSHAYSGILWEMLCSEESTGNVVVIEEKAVELGVIEKTWTNSAVKIFLQEIPQWIKILPDKLGNSKIIVLNEFLDSISIRAYLIMYSKFMHQGKKERDLVAEYIKDLPIYLKFKIYSFYIAYPFYNFLVQKFKKQ